MPIPNTDYTTAEIISSLPFSASLSANDGGVTYDLWYQYTAAAVEVISVFGYGGTYIPTTRIYLKHADGSPVSLPDDLGVPAGQNIPITFPTEVGKTYFFKFDNTSGFVTPADLAISIMKHTPQDYPDESIMIPDDTWGFPGAVLSPTTGEVLYFVSKFPAGEEGDSLTVAEGGEILVEDYNTDSIVLYDKNLNLIISIPETSLGDMSILGIQDIIAAHTSNPKFYVGVAGGGATNAYIRKVSKTGVIDPTVFALPTAGLTTFAVTPDETIAYITGQASSTSAIIKRWDLVNNVALTDWTVSTLLQSVYILKNGNIVISDEQTSTTMRIREYDSAHNLLHTYTFPNTTSIRMKHADDNPISMWCWFETSSPSGFSRFIKLRLSDGVYLQDFTRTIYESGSSDAPVTASPTDRFGHSYSCPIFILYQGSGEPEPGPTDGGLYFINPTKAERHDSYYPNVEKKIPNPTIDTPLFGE